MLFFTIIIFTWLYIYLAFQKKFWTLCPSLFFLHIPVICLLYGNSDEYTIYMCLYSFTKSEFYTSLFEFLFIQCSYSHCRIFEIMSLKLFSKLKQRNLLVGLKGYGHYLNWKFPNLILDFHCQFWFMFVIP